jgi:hypothetical protein
MKCVGSTDGWIAIDCPNVEYHKKHKYLLHNEFSGTTLSPTELDAVIGHVSELFEIRKVLLRSTPDDVIVVMTNHRTCPIILTRIGNLGPEKNPSASHTLLAQDMEASIYNDLIWAAPLLVLPVLATEHTGDGGRPRTYGIVLVAGFRQTRTYRQAWPCFCRLVVGPPRSEYPIERAHV